MDPSSGAPRTTSRLVLWLAGALLLLALTAHFVGATTAWTSRNLPGHEFRQSQTAISALFIQRENNFSLAYPTPVLGKPWSIPLEFPLYQWSAVGVSNLTGWPLVQSGRAVALLCFYLTLPALALVLRRLGMAPAQRWVALALVVACPLHVFYARSFLIETMALMFSWWFLAAFGEALHRRSAAWWALALAAGSAAGLVKVTTFMLYLIVAAGWTAVELWRTRRDTPAPDRRRALLQVAAWSVACVALPIAATLAWTSFADAVKARNPAAEFLRAENMSSFNFGLGIFELRFKAHTWEVIAGYCQRSILPLPVAAGALLLALGAGGRWRRAAVASLGLFVLAPVIFPMLYASHDYYFVATAVFLLLVAGFACAGLMERSRGWPGLAAAALVCAVQLWSYARGYYRQQLVNYAGPDDLSSQLSDMTKPDDVLVIAGRDWNSMLPFYAGRRALMLRGGTESDGPLIRASIAQLRGESIGALVLSDEQRGNSGVLELALELLDIDPRAALVFPQAAVYLPRRRVAEYFQGITPFQRDDRPLLSLPPLLGHWPDLKGHDVEVSDLHPVQRRIFAALQPAPVRFFSTHGAGAILRGDDQLLNTHSVTRLWFRVPPGARRFRATFGMYPGCWEDPAHATDGIEFAVSRCLADGQTERLHSRVLSPVSRAADRGDQLVEFALPAAAGGGELVVEFLPGPQNGGAYDWAYLGALRIE